MAEAAYSLLEDFSARQQYNRRASRFLISVFFLVFLLVGAVVDFLYFDLGAGSGVPVATSCTPVVTLIGNTSPMETPYVPGATATTSPASACDSA